MAVELVINNSLTNLESHEAILVTVPDGLNPKTVDSQLGTKKYQVFARDAQGTPVFQTDEAHKVELMRAASQKATKLGITDLVKTDWTSFLGFRRDNRPQVAAFSGSITSSNSANYVPQESVSEFSVHERFEMFRDYLARIAGREMPGIAVIGNRGLGKSSNTVEIFDEFGLSNMMENNGVGDYWIMSGSVSGPGLFNALYQCRNGGILVLDDCRFGDAKCKEYMKAVLDTKKARYVTNGLFKEHEGLPSTFRFDGHIILISNLSEAEIRLELGERVPTINMWMTNDEILTYIETEIIPESNAAPELLQETFEFLKAHYKELPEFNLRTWVHLLNERLHDGTGERWQKFAKFTCLRTSAS